MEWHKTVRTLFWAPSWRPCGFPPPRWSVLISTPPLWDKVALTSNPRTREVVAGGKQWNQIKISLCKSGTVSKAATVSQLWTSISKKSSQIKAHLATTKWVFPVPRPPAIPRPHTWSCQALVQLVPWDPGRRLYFFFLTNCYIYFFPLF